MKELILFCTSEKYQKLLNKFDSETTLHRTLVVSEPVTGTHSAIMHLLNADVSQEIKDAVDTAFHKFNCKIVSKMEELPDGQPHLQLEIDLKSFPKDACRKLIALNKKVQKEESKKNSTAR